MTVQIVRFTTTEAHVPPAPEPVTVLGSHGLFASHDGSVRS